MRASLASLVRHHRHGLVLVLVGVILMLVGITRYGGPAYRSDEIGYLSKAAALGGLENGLASSWHGGYSLLLSPFFRLAGSVQAAWPAVIVVNVLAVLAALGCYWRCLRSSGVCGREEGFRLILLSLLFFGTTAYTGWAFTNCVFMAVVALLALLLSARSASLVGACAIGLIAGYGYWVHPTGLLLVVAAAVASQVRPAEQRRRWHALVILAVGVLMALVYGGVVHPWISTLQGGVKGHYDSQIRGYLEQLRGQPLATVATLCVAIVNGFATSSIATYGYLASPLLALPALVRGRRLPRLTPVLVFLLLSWLGLVIFSAFLALTDPDDLQLAFHQRYTHPVLPGLLLFGLALSPSAIRARWPALLLSTAPILTALMIALVRGSSNQNFSVVDGLGATTIFLANDDAVLMLALGLLATAIVQLAGWRAYLVVAGALWIIGWHGMDRIHRKILASASRIPAFTDAPRVLRSKGLTSCLQLGRTRATPAEYTNTLSYYFSGQDIALYDLDASSNRQTLPSNTCDVLLRPLKSDDQGKVSYLSGGIRATCKPMILDTYSTYVLEDCSDGEAYLRSGVHARLLAVDRDLIDLERSLHLTPARYRLIHAIHTSAMASPARDFSAIPRSLSRSGGAVRFDRKQTLLHGPYLDLDPGTYRAIFDGLVFREGSLLMDVRSDKGKREHAVKAVEAGQGLASIDFTLNEPVQNLEVRLLSTSKGQVVLPRSLLLYKVVDEHS